MEQFSVWGLYTSTQAVYLPPGVIKIVSVGHLITLSLWQIEKRVTYHTAANPMHTQRTGWVGAHVFDLSCLARACALLENTIPGGDDILNLLRQPRFGKTHIQETGWCYLNGGNNARRRQMRLDNPGNLDRWLAHEFLNLHRHR